MLKWALIFLVVGLVLGVLGFGGIAGTAYSFHQGAGTAVGDQAAAGFQGHSGGDAWGGASWTAYGFTMPGAQ